MADLGTVDPEGGVCCSPTEQKTCCEPEAKAECCGDAHDERCGCGAGAAAEPKEVREAEQWTGRDRVHHRAV